MSKPIYEGNKIVAKRHREHVRRIHKQKLQAARAFTDNKEPDVYALQHLKVNMKKEQMLEERYNEIDRHNQLLLHRMTEIIRHPPPHQVDRGPGPTTLNKDRRRRELVRITQENQAILKRIQKAQPIYNHVEWEDSYRRSTSYLRNRCEFPPMPSSRGKTPSRGGSFMPLVGSKPLSPSQDMRATASSGPLSNRSGVAEKPRSAPGGGGTEEDLRYVLKEGKKIGGTYFLVEMVTDGRTLAVSAYDGDAQRTLELLVSEKNHRKLFREAGGDYNLIAERLRVQHDQLVLDQIEDYQ